MFSCNFKFRVFWCLGTIFVSILGFSLLSAQDFTDESWARAEQSRLEVEKLKSHLRQIFDPDIGVTDDAARTIAIGLGSILFEESSDPVEIQKLLIEEAIRIVTLKQPSLDFVRERQRIYSESLMESAERKLAKDRENFRSNYFWIAAGGLGLGALAGFGISFFKQRKREASPWRRHFVWAGAGGICLGAISALAGPPLILETPTQSEVVSIPDLSEQVDQ